MEPMEGRPRTSRVLRKTQLFLAAASLAIVTPWLASRAWANPQSVAEPVAHAELLAAKPAVELPAPSPRPFALVELFTSEGCSSCPPADENLARLTEEADAQQSRVFTLELHVDYWNMLGWEDPFSSVVHSDRQRAYGEKRGTRGVYTPQMLINGHAEVVGSRAAESRAAIAAALSDKPSVGVAVHAQREKEGLRVSYRLGSHAEPLDLNLALSDDAVKTKVLRGENASKVLDHRHVVRAFQTVHLPASSAPSATATVLLPWPADAEGRAFVTAYAVDTNTLRIIGADGRAVD